MAPATNHPRIVPILGTLAFGGFAWMLTSLFFIERLGLIDEAIAVMSGFARKRPLGRVEDRVRSLAGCLADRVRDRALPPPR